MKVAVLVPGFSAHERDWCIPALQDFVRVLAQTHETHVYTLRWPERRECYRVFGAEVYALGGRARLGARAAALWARALRAIGREHGRNPFDVIHAFWVDEPGWVATLAGAWLRRPVILSLAGGELVGLRDIAYGLQVLPGRRAWVRWMLKRAKLVTGGSDYLLEMAKRHVAPAGHHRLRRAPLGVDLDRFGSQGLPPTSQRLASLNVGALYPVKGQAMLLRAMACVPEVRAQIVGAGPVRPRLEQLAQDLGIEERVNFLGGVDHGALPSIYGRASVFVQTSRHEAQGMALLEAAACGVPVIGTPVGVLPEIGWPAADEAELAAGLRELGENGDRRMELGRRAQALVAERFALRSTVAAFQQLYAEAAAGG